MAKELRFSDFNTEEALHRLEMLSHAAREVLRGPLGKRTGLEIDFGPGNSRDHDPHSEKVYECVTSEWPTSGVEIWHHERRWNYSDRDPWPATEAFLIALRSFDAWGQFEDTLPPSTTKDLCDLIDKVAAAEKIRGRELEFKRARAQERANAVQWRLQHPAEPVTSLSEVQADLILSICNAANILESRGQCRLPSSRNQLLGQLEDMERRDGGKWTKEEVRKVGATIEIPWPLSYSDYPCADRVRDDDDDNDNNDDDSSGLRALYIKRGRGRAVAEVERVDAEVLVMGSDYLRVLAEQSLATASS